MNLHEVKWIKLGAICDPYKCFCINNQAEICSPPFASLARKPKRIIRSNIYELFIPYELLKTTKF